MVFEKEDSTFLRCMTLKNVALYRIEELYPLFSKAFAAGNDKLVYHALLYMKEYSIAELLPALRQNTGAFNGFNGAFAVKILGLMS